MAKKYVDIEDVIKTVCDNCCEHSMENPFACEGCDERTEILKIPAADVVEVVRCKNCKYRGEKESPEGRWDCTLLDRLVAEDCFCFLGTTKDGYRWITSSKSFKIDGRCK